MTKIPKGYPITGHLIACKAKEGYALCSGDFEVALVNLDAVSPDASREYALSIVRVVNNHGLLIEAMQRAADMLPANAACGILRAALAKAKES